MINLFITARFEMKNGYPKLVLIHAGRSTSTTYLGPTDLHSLVGFVNEETANIPPIEKVGTQTIEV